MHSQNINELNLDNLPQDIALQIADHLTPEQALNLAAVNKHFNHVINKHNGSRFWKIKFCRHFYHHFNKIKDKKDIDWKQEFFTAYQTDYAELSDPVKELYSLVKEGQINVLKNKKIDKAVFNACFYDQDGCSLLDWARGLGQQLIVDYFYQEIENYYSISKIEKDQIIKELDLKKQDEEGKNLFFWAILCDQTKEHITSLIDGGSVLKPDNYYYHAIFLAIFLDRLDLVELLVEREPQLVLIPTQHKVTPLMIAAKGGKKRIVNFLLEKSKDNLDAQIPFLKENREEIGKTALHYAAQNGYLDVVNILLNAGANTRVTTRICSLKPIHLAASNGHVEIVARFLKHDPTLLNIKDFFPRTPLLIAVQAGHLKLVKFLLKQPSIITDCTDAASKGILDSAAYSGHVDIVKFLLEQPSYSPLTPQHKRAIKFAIQTKHIDVIGAFLEKDPSWINFIDEDNHTPLMNAIIGGDIGVIKYLLQQPGIDVNIATRYFNEEHTAFHFAIQTRENAIIEALMGAHLDLSVSFLPLNKKYIHYAAEYDCLNLVKLLLEKDSSLLNVKDANGFTPLMYAAKSEYGHIEVLDYLSQQPGIEKDALGELQDLRGRVHQGNALDIALYEYHYGTATVLLHNGFKPKAPVSRNISYEMEAKLNLVNYIPTRENQSLYKTTFTFFCFTLNFGCSRERKVAAAKVLKAVEIDGEDENLLKGYYREFHNGELGKIYRRLGRR